MHRSLILLVFGVVSLGGCAGTSAPPAPALGTVQAYRLGAGDGLRLIVYGEEKLSGEYRVSDSGMVTVPLIGAIKADGQTIDELSVAIANAYRTSGILTAPRVAAEVLSYRPFYILGEVNKPGQYPFAPGMTVEQAVATANGYTYRAKKSEVMLRSFGTAEQSTYRLDPGTMVKPGDTITIPERHF